MRTKGSESAGFHAIIVLETVVQAPLNPLEPLSRGGEQEQRFKRRQRSE